MAGNARSGAPVCRHGGPLVSPDEDNRDRLRAHLDRLGWSQRRLAEWLTQQGQPTSTRAVENWFSRGPNSRACPAYPSLLIERSDDTS